MRIKRLEIQGFKSFADRTVLHFGDGITGVVGPNGCGKSNIVDALRWAMGEQSAKHLRGDGMSDVIFAGSESRGPMGLAEVTITFKNDDGSLMPPELRSLPEVSVTRRLFRDGTSEYQINRQVARLRDVVELFLGTGIGTKSYSIIEQGRIGLIVTSKPEDRRSLIEDAAGITKYKSRRKQAERRLEAAEQNLLRVNDVLGELKRRIGALERQARKAERYKELKAELRTLDLSSAARRAVELSALAETEATREARARQALADAEQEAAAAELALSASAEAKDALAAQVAEERARLAEVEQSLAVGTKHVEHLTRQDAGVRQRRGDAERERELLSEQREAARVEREELLALSEQLEAARAGEGDALHAEEANLDAALVDIKAREADGDRLKHAVFDVTGRIGDGHNTLGHLSRRAEDLEQRRARKSSEAQAAEDASLAHRAEASEASQRLSAERAERLAVDEAREAVEARLDALQAEYMEVEARVLTLRGELVDKRARHASLLEIQKNYEGCQEGVRAVMRQAQEDPALAKRLHGLVADVLVAPSALEVAVEAALGDRLQYVIVDDQDTGVGSIGHLKTTADGRSTFIPLDLREDHVAWAPRRATRRPVPSDVQGLLADAVARGEGAPPPRAELRAELHAELTLDAPSLIGDAPSIIAASAESSSDAPSPRQPLPTEPPPHVTRSISDRPPSAELLELAREAADELAGVTAVELRSRDAAHEAAAGDDAQDTDPRSISDRPPSAEAVAYAEALRAAARGDTADLPYPDLAAEEEDRWPDMTAPGVHGKLMDLVRTKDGYAHVARVLLGDMVVVEDLATARALWRNNGHRKTMVTLAGEVLDPIGVLAGGSTSGVSAGLLAKKREIQELAAEVVELEAQLQTITARRTTLEADVAALEDESRALAQRGHEGDLGIVKLEQDVRRLEASAAHSEARRQAVDAERAAIDGERADVDRERERIDQSLADLDARRQELEARLGAVQGELGEAREKAELLGARVTELKIEIAAQREKREATRRGLARAEARIVELESRLTRLDDNLAASTEELDRIAVELYEAATEKDTLAGEAETRREALAALEADLAALAERLRLDDEAMRAARRRVDEGRAESSDAQLRLRELTLAREALAAQLDDRYQLTLEAVIESHAGSESQSEEAGPDQAERIAELRKKLEGMGEINLMAIEEFEESRTRHDFLSAQKADLDRAIDALKAAIKKINRTSQERFLETFHLVNEKFQQVFPRLFHGGKASLELTAADSPLEAGVEMMAQPPGKKLQSVSLLSGGEKALTAVALIFSIFLIKPTPFCLLDEVDAPLDDANVGRYNDLIRDMSSISQFIVITHNKRTMEVPDHLYGVTMEEPGISKLVSVDIKATEQHLRRVS